MDAFGAGGLSVAASVTAVISAFRDADTLLQRLKVKRVSLRLPLPPPSLEDTIGTAPSEIETARRRGVERLGRVFEQGDYVAVITIQQITIQLQSGLLEKLRNAANYEEHTDFTAMVDLADAARDGTISALNALRQRLVSAGSDMGQGQGQVPTIIRPPEQQHPAFQQPSLPPLPARNRDTRRTTPSYLDPQEAAMMRWEADMRLHETQQHRASGSQRKSSLLGGLLKRNPTRASSEGHVQRQDDLAPYAARPPPLFHNRPNSHLAEGPISPVGPAPYVDHSARFTFSPVDDEHYDFAAPAPSAPLSRNVSGADTHSTYSRASRTNSVMSSSQASTAPTTSTRGGDIALRAASVPAKILATPTPQNDFLGFCKGAWKAQNDDPKAMIDGRDFAQSAQSKMSFPSCSKCAFRGHTDSKVIWNKVVVDEARGLKYRWGFLAKSHVKQKSVKERNYAYQCLFCVFGGQREPVIYTQNTYLDHVAKEHRKEALDGVLLYRTRCINDRVCENGEKFDINLFPVGNGGPGGRRESVGSEYSGFKGYERLVDDVRAFELAAD